MNQSAHVWREAVKLYQRGASRATFRGFWGSIYLELDRREDILHESRFSFPAASSGFAGKTALMFLLFITWSAAALAQSGAMSPNQGESDGVSVGGKWLEFSSADKMTGAKNVRFELQSNNYFREDTNYKPRVNLICSGGKLRLAEFNPGMKLPPPNRIIFGQPELEVRVRIDDYNGFKHWRWLRGRYLSMDKDTTRGLMSGQVFNIELPTFRSREIAEFSPAGLDFGRVREACDLKPKKPSKD
jgi:hypothetical protein